MGERHVLRLCEVNLQRQGWDVLMASSDLECLQTARTCLPEMLVVDASLLTRGGAMVRDTLAEDPLTAQIKVIVLGEEWPKPKA
jgi:two-component system alkaline phosphatase synthesis response regulator PhoP/two-component system response regulator VicR